MTRIHNILSKEIRFENSNITKRYYIKISTLRTGLIIIYFLSVIISIIIFQLEHAFSFDTETGLEIENQDKIHQFRNQILIFSSFLAFNQIIIELEIQKNLIKYHFNQGALKSKCNLKNPKYLYPLLLFIIMSLLHPNYICENLSYFNLNRNFTFYNKISSSFIVYSVNDILSIFGLLKLGILFYHYFGNLNYNSDLASRCWYFKKQNERF